MSKKLPPTPRRRRHSKLKTDHHSLAADLNFGELMAHRGMGSPISVEQGKAIIRQPDVVGELRNIMKNSSYRPKDPNF